MDGNTKRLDFRRATICVPPSALHDHSVLTSDLSHASFTSPLCHRFSPRGSVIFSETKSVSPPLGSNAPPTDAISPSVPDDSFTISNEISAMDEHDSFGEHPVRTRRLSSRLERPLGFPSSGAFPDRDSFEKRRRSISGVNPFIPSHSLEEGKSASVSGSLGPQSIQENKIQELGAHQLHHPNVFSNISTSEKPESDLSKRSKSLSIQGSTPLAKTPILNHRFAISHLSKKLFGSQYSDDPKTEVSAAENWLSTTHSQPNLSKTERPRGFPPPVDAPSFTYPQRESPSFADRSQSPRPISPFGTLLLRTEF